MIIAINGYICSGKDTAGKMIQWMTSMTHKDGSFQKFLKDEQSDWQNPVNEWEIRKFGGKLKQIASILTGIPIEKFEDQEFKKSYLGPEWNTYIPIAEESQQKFGTDRLTIPMTVRELLQKLGTDAIRNNLHVNTWVNATLADYKPYSVRGSEYEEEESKWIITDIRFPNEAKAVKERGGVVIRINRMKMADNISGPGGTHLHPSETSLDDWDFDFKINNDGSLQQLEEKVRTILKTLSIIS